MQIEDLQSKISGLFNSLTAARTSRRDLIAEEEWEKAKKLQSFQRNQESLILEKDQSMEQLKTDYEDELTKKKIALNEAIEKIKMLEEKVEDKDKELSYIKEIKDQIRSKLRYCS